MNDNVYWKTTKGEHISIDEMHPDDAKKVLKDIIKRHAVKQVKLKPFSIPEDTGLADALKQMWLFDNKDYSL